ncbi:hypothetical protein [Paraglaciecola chathamensis]|uniref:Uncharacterized protein n=1 Tax=Paraglaciecola agarilytica NO2 TaxID=1125747 RepID=A0ABQ0I0T0_9ALTE|nr:hypothetical protein [Paraglaciecola agarilytica]GAC02925.1 hypothetical protein GAGA_0060 [Paraglaciecola agarilytica NO2]
MILDNKNISVDKKIITILNQLFEIERKSKENGHLDKIARNIERIKSALIQDNQSGEIFYEDPTGEEYSETRNDLEVHIVGENTQDLIVVDVIKPIIRYGNRQLGLTQVIQRGLVSVTSKENIKDEE